MWKQKEVVHMSIAPWEVEIKHDKEGRRWAFSWTYCKTPERKAMFARIVNEKLNPPVPVTAEMVDHNEQPMEGGTLLYTTALLSDPTASPPRPPRLPGWLARLGAKVTAVFGRRSLAAS